MNRNETGVFHSEPVNSDLAQISLTESRSLCEHFRKRKSMWITCFIIVSILIILGITIPTIIIIKKKGNTPETISTIDYTNAKWIQNGLTIIGEHGEGSSLDSLNVPQGIYVDNDDHQSIYIADSKNHRILKWKSNAKIGEVVAGGNGEGNETNQLNVPMAVTVDKKNNSLIICDSANERVVRWSLQNRTNQEILISNIVCQGLTMDHNGDLYVSDAVKNEVRRWKPNEENGTIVAGGNEEGDKFNQLDLPTFIFVDKNYTVYVSDSANHRVMKWMKGAKEGIVVAGGPREGNNLAQLSIPIGVIVDHLSNVYVADAGNHRIVRWLAGAAEGSIIVGGNGEGNQPNQLNQPGSLSFDREGNLYVVDWENHRIQKFDIDID